MKQGDLIKRIVAVHRGSSVFLSPEMENWTRLAHWAQPMGAEQVLEELGDCLEERRAPRDGFAAAESLRARAMLQFCDVL